MAAKLLVALKIAGLGLVGIFVSIIIIMIVTALISKIPEKSKDKEQ